MSQGRQSVPADTQTEPRARSPIALAAIGAGCVFLCLYLACLCPTVYWSDSGELIASCVEPGIAHPNGSPVYTMVGWLFSLLPAGSPAWRVNLLSAASAAATVVLTFLAAYTIARRRHSGSYWLPLAASLVSAIALGVSPGLWHKATVANKYPLATALCAAVLLVSVLPRPRYLLSGALLGLGYGVHAVTVCAAPILLVQLLRAETGNRARAVCIMASGVCLGLLAFVYLPLRSMADPVRDWGNPETLSGFWWLISGQEFRGLIFGASPREWLPNLTHCAGLFSSHLGLPVLALALGAVVAMALLWRRGPRDQALLLTTPLCMLAADLILVVTYDMTSDRFVWEAYLLPGYVAIVVLAAAGAAWLSEVRSWHCRRLAWATVAVVLVLALAGGARHYPIADRSNVRAAREHGLELIEQVGHGGILAHNASQIGFLVMYLDEVEGIDSGVINVYLPLLAYDWYVQQLAKRHPSLGVPPASLNAPRRFIDAHGDQGIWTYPGGLGRYFSPEDLHAEGVLYRVDGGAARPGPDLEKLAARAMACDHDAATVGVYTDLIYQFAMHFSQQGQVGLGKSWLGEAIRIGTTCRARDDSIVRQTTSLCRLGLAGLLVPEGKYAQAEEQLDQARYLWSASLRAEREVRWGLVLARQGDGTGALVHLRRALRHDPGNSVARRVIGSLAR